MGTPNMAAPRSSRSSRFAALTMAAATLAVLALYSSQQPYTAQPSTFAVVSRGLMPLSAGVSNNGATSGRAETRVVCRGYKRPPVKLPVNKRSRQRCMQIKMRRKLRQEEGQKMVLLTSKELRLRTTKVKLLRRADIMETERWLHEDPNTPKHQWSVVKTRQYMEANQVESDERIREQFGIPLPPIRFMRDALNSMRMERLSKGGASKGQVKQEQQEGDDKEDKPAKAKARSPRAGGKIDLSDINTEFMNYRGIAVSKKKQQQAQMRKKR